MPSLFYTAAILCRSGFLTDSASTACFAGPSGTPVPPADSHFSPNPISSSLRRNPPASQTPPARCWFAHIRVKSEKEGSRTPRTRAKTCLFIITPCRARVCKPKTRGHGRSWKSARRFLFRHQFSRRSAEPTTTRLHPFHPSIRTWFPGPRNRSRFRASKSEAGIVTRPA